jgi:hypothetical protein
MTQCEAVLEFMRVFGEITQKDAYNMDIYRLASRISDLKREGYEIKTEYKEVDTRYGKTKIAVYRLGGNDEEDAERVF